MDAVWLILDSLSAAATPFVSDGPGTMPRLDELACEQGTVFSRAYVPGPASPSSHGSFFTGRLPSETGMTEASPFFDRPEMQTIAGALDQTHKSFLISSNPFIFNGLQRDFDEIDDLRNEQYLLFESATDPGRFGHEIDTDSTLRQYLSFIRRGGKPVRSLFNGIYYKLWMHRQGAGIPRQVEGDGRSYQYAAAMNKRIDRFLSSNASAFVCANYMDVHPPFDASPAAVDAVADGFNRDQLPIAVRGRDIYDQIQNGDTEAGERMRALYYAAIWDLDQELTPFIKRLVDDGTFVVVTADHGTWFDRSRELDEERIHVPLLIFHPDQRAYRTVSASVNIRSLAATTMQAVTGDTGGFEGPSLLDIADDQVSITEFIHDDSWGHGPVSPGGTDGSVQRDIAAVLGETRVDLINEEISVVRGSGEAVERLRETLTELNSKPVLSGTSDHITYDEATAERLRELGYLE